MNNKLQVVLGQMVRQERWRKKPKLKGTLTKKGITKSGNLKLVIENTAPVYVLQKNKNLFATAQTAKVGEAISVAGRRWLGNFFCQKSSIKQKE